MCAEDPRYNDGRHCQLYPCTQLMNTVQLLPLYHCILCEGESSTADLLYSTVKKRHKSKYTQHTNMSQIFEPAPFIFQHRIKCLIRGQVCTSTHIMSKNTIEDKLQERLIGIMCKIISLQSAGHECHLGCDAV